MVDRHTGEVKSLTKQRIAVDARRERYRLLEASAEVLSMFYGSDSSVKANGYKKQHRTCDCHRVTVSPTAQILKSEAHRKALHPPASQRIASHERRRRSIDDPSHTAFRLTPDPVLDIDAAKGSNRGKFKKAGGSNDVLETLIRGF